MADPPGTGADAAAITAVLTDVEGTTTPIRFVHEVLFPFARERLPDFLRHHGNDPEPAALLAAVREAFPETDPLAQLLRWMDEDNKATPLKTLQGLIWREGYRDGTLKGRLYPDVAPALRRWTAGGVRLACYSSGSEDAQKLIFGFSDAGDLAPLFAGFFDTRVGAKRARESYAHIAGRLGQDPDAILFLSDVEAELDAAAAAGLRTCQIVRPADGTVAGRNHPVAADFDAAGRLFFLPAR
ncbi:acireductone synthase [Rhizosaccharibacter radicis]|uniref:Enolase-phosphatase E1 n=1 Tax=Rhizosaccharibacter radicis TaxID=2782605 RepID=A0ABT1W1A0_9PROT|nr:acireductone synthase [Acetobacteraceae bacterium KSS12]